MCVCVCVYEGHSIDILIFFYKNKYILLKTFLLDVNSV